MYDYQDEDTRRQQRQDDEAYAPPPAALPVHPGANTGSGPWAPGYDPGANWNNGTAPTNGSTWDMTDNNWTAPAAPAATVTPPPSGPAPSTPGNGSVPSSYRPPQSGINVPSSQLPGDISALFGKVPEKTPIQSAYQDALLKFMQRGQTTPTLDDSILGPQTEVYRAAQQRSQESQRRSNAERASANGMSQSGYLDNLINKGQQQQGFNTASFNANLLGGEMGKRREELQAALQLASATGNAEAARELQARLAQVSAMMQQQALNLQGQLGGGDLALRLMQTQMGNNQFYDQLGVNTSLNLEGLNQSALQRILSGGG